MPYRKFRDLMEGEQIDLLYRAVKQLQARFDDHAHLVNGQVVVGVYNDSVDLDGRFEEVDEDC